MKWLDTAKNTYISVWTTCIIWSGTMTLFVMDIQKEFHFRCSSIGGNYILYWTMWERERERRGEQNSAWLSPSETSHLKYLYYQYIMWMDVWGRRADWCLRNKACSRREKIAFILYRWNKWLITVKDDEDLYSYVMCNNLCCRVHVLRIMQFLCWRDHMQLF